MFDGAAKKLEGVETPLQNVAISQASMTGAGNNISVGIDRSSWLIGFQTYGQESTHGEFGDCSLRP